MGLGPSPTPSGCAWDRFCLGCIFRVESFTLLDFLACLEVLNLLIKTCINYSRTTGKERKSLFFFFSFRKVMGAQEHISMMCEAFTGAGNTCSSEDAMRWCKGDKITVECLFCSAERS